jgi:hypothetical protein
MGKMDSKEEYGGSAAGAGIGVGAASSRSSTSARPRSLDPELCEIGLSGLGKTPDSLAHAYLKFHLPGQNLIDIQLLSEYPHVQDIDVSDNTIKVP